MPVKFIKLFSKLRATACVRGENKLNVGGLFLSQIFHELYTSAVF